MNEEERRQLMETPVEEIEIYEEKQANGQWLTSITFRFPIIRENTLVGLDNGLHVETVCVLSRGDAHLHI